MAGIAGTEEARPRAPALALGAGARLRTWALPGLLVALFIALSTAYNVRVPLYEAPDEIVHARYVRTIAEEGRLPTLESPDEYESWQPPLYYAVGAAALQILSLDSPPELTTNPSFEWNPDLPGHRSNFLHTSQEDYPYSEPVLAVHVLRGIGTLFSVGTVLVIYLTALLIFPNQRLLAFAAGATASLLPQFAFISATVSNDPAAFFFASATVYLALRYLRDSSPAMLALAAVSISLGALTKLNTVVVAVLPLAVVLLQSISWRQKVGYLALLTFVPLLAAGWFYVRSLTLWGAIYPDHLMWPHSPHPIWHEDYRRIFLPNLSETFWYAGGPTSIRLSPIIYQALDVTAVLAVGGVIVTLVSSSLSRTQRQGIALLSALPLLALGMIVFYSMTVDFMTQGRHAFTAISAFAILMPLGIAALFSREKARDHPAMLALPALLLLVNISIFAITLPRYY